MTTYSRSNLPEEMGEYERRGSVRAVKIDGRFTVATRYGFQEVDSGYLVVDEQGWPTAVADDAFESQHQPK